MEEIIRIGEGLSEIGQLHLDFDDSMAFERVKSILCIPLSILISNNLHCCFLVFLVGINLHCNNLHTLENFPRFLGLVELNLSSNKFSTVAFPELAYLTSLTLLDMSSNCISSIAHMPYLPALTNLKLSFNFITSLESLDENAPNLNEIDVRCNLLKLPSSLLPIKALKSLQKASIGGGSDPNPISSRASNMARLFSETTALKTIDDKTQEYWYGLEDKEAIEASRTICMPESFVPTQFMPQQSGYSRDTDADR